MNKISSPLKDVCLFQKNKYIFIYRIFISRWKMSITTRYTNRNVFYDKISQDKTERDKFSPRLKGVSSMHNVWAHYAFVIPRW